MAEADFMAAQNVAMARAENDEAANGSTEEADVNSIAMAMATTITNFKAEAKTATRTAEGKASSSMDEIAADATTAAGIASAFKIQNAIESENDAIIGEIKA